MRQLLFLFLFLPLIVQAEKKLLWGDTHLHTYYSPDAYLNQNQSIGPDTAYRFAKGWPVTHPSTQEKVQLNTPLDFLVIADHAESMGVIKASIEKTIPRDNLSFTEKIKVYLIERLFSYLNDNPKGLQLLFKYTTDDTTDVVEGAKSTVGFVVPNGQLIEQSTWQSITDAAEEHYEPGTFTSLIGWEWTSIPAGANLHRVIFTNSDAKVAQSYQPFSSALSNYPEDLWQWLEHTAQITGADFIAIPHNSNISRGFMFPSNKRLRDTAIDIDWINQRAKWETAVEITQVKGDSEIDPLLSPDDEFADFERECLAALASDDDEDGDVEKKLSEKEDASHPDIPGLLEAHKSTSASSSHSLTSEDRNLTTVVATGEAQPPAGFGAKATLLS